MNKEQFEKKMRSKLNSKKSEIFPKKSGIDLNVHAVEIEGNRFLIMSDQGLKSLIEAIVKMTMIANDAMPEFFKAKKK